MLATASILVLALSFHSAWAAVALGEAQQHPDHPGQCYDVSTNEYKNVGDQWPMANGCGRIMCEKWGATLYFSYSTCPSVAATSPCVIMSGTSGSSYPHCCPRVECPTEKNEIDQLMAGDSHRLNEEEWPTYDATLDENDHDQMDEDGFSNVFPLWRLNDGNAFVPKRK